MTEKNERYFKINGQKWYVVGTTTIFFFFSCFPMSRVYRDCGYVQVLYNRTRTWGRVTVLGRRHLLEYK